MVNKDKVPDAWDDDWEAQADKAAKAEEQQAPEQPVTSMTRAERLARHADSQRKLWESACVSLSFATVATKSGLTALLGSPLRSSTSSR
jgi:hypothetical protein